MNLLKENKNVNVQLKRKNNTVFLILSLVFISMLSLSYASVPLYEIFCQLTGFAGTPKKVDTYVENNLINENQIKIRFDSNVSPKLNWEFFPEKNQQSIKIGEETKIIYHAKNIDDKSLVGTSVFNVSPAKAGQYFMKIECFCFNEQILKPGESISMPVVFYIDTEIKTDLNTLEINEITLSYTFLPFIDQKLDNIKLEG